MSTSTAERPDPSPVGVVLKTWRAHRRMSQLELSAVTGVTARHISFVETGRASPTRTMLETLADALDMPLRDRNDLHVAAGYVAPYTCAAYDSAELEVVSAAIDRILEAHQPLPAVALDRSWDLVRANAAAVGLFSTMIELPAAGDSQNILDLMFGPLRPFVANWGRLAPALLARARREAIGGVPDRALAERIARLAEQLEPSTLLPNVEGPVLTVEFLTRPGVVDRFFSTITTIGTALDVSAQEIRLELFHPADADTLQRHRTP